MNRYKGVTIKNSVLELMNTEDIMTTIDYVLRKFGKDRFTDLTITVHENCAYTNGKYFPTNHKIQLYRKNTFRKGRIYAMSVLIHELVHAIQREHHGGICNPVNSNPPIKAKGSAYNKYLGDPNEFEAYTVQYSFLEVEYGVGNVLPQYQYYKEYYGVDLKNYIK